MAQQTVLDANQIASLTKKADRVTSTSIPWSQNPTVRKELAEAFRSVLTEVTLKGRRFFIKYNLEGKAWVHPESGSVPCGWFDPVKFVEAYDQSA